MSLLSTSFYRKKWIFVEKHKRVHDVIKILKKPWSTFEITLLKNGNYRNIFENLPGNTSQTKEQNYAGRTLTKWFDRY